MATCSNCWVEGLREFRWRYRWWAAEGYPRASRPWIRLQPSKSRPHWVLHMVVGGARMPAIEFVPLVRRDVPAWLVWTRALFRGRHRPADFPNTEPKAPDDLSR
jgi:hypothetical protein